jgi:hypothetical protein
VSCPRLQGLSKHSWNSLSVCSLSYLVRILHITSVGLVIPSSTLQVFKQIGLWNCLKLYTYCKAQYICDQNKFTFREFGS